MANVFAQITAFLQAVAAVIGALGFLTLALAIYSVRKPLGRWIGKDRDGLEKLAPLLAKLFDDE